MPTDFTTENEGLQFTDTNDIALRDGTDNVEQQLGFVVRDETRQRYPIRTATDRTQLVGALRDRLRGHPYADEIGQITVERGADTVTVAVAVGSDEYTIPVTPTP